MEQGWVGPGVKWSTWQPPPAAPQPAPVVGPDPAQAGAQLRPGGKGLGANFPDFLASASPKPTAPDKAWGLLQGPRPQNPVLVTLPPPLPLSPLSSAASAEWGSALPTLGQGTEGGWRPGDKATHLSWCAHSPVALSFQEHLAAPGGFPSLGLAVVGRAGLQPHLPGWGNRRGTWGAWAPQVARVTELLDWAPGDPTLRPLRPTESCQVPRPGEGAPTQAGWQAGALEEVTWTGGEGRRGSSPAPRLQCRDQGLLLPLLGVGGGRAGERG